MSLSDKSRRIFRFLVTSQDVANEVLLKVLEVCPSLFGQLNEKQTLHVLIYALQQGDVKGLELARRHGAVTPASALFFLEEALTRRAPRPRKRFQDYPDLNRKAHFEQPAEPDLELQVVDWLLDNFTLSTKAASAVVGAMSVPAFFCEAVSIDTICLLAQKQPLDQKARTNLLRLLGHAFAENFLYILREISALLDTEDEALWWRFPVLRNLALIAREEKHKAQLEKEHRSDPYSDWAYIPGVSPLPPGTVVISEETAARYERFLEEMGWFIRTYQENYGRQAAEDAFRVPDYLPVILVCASCYAHGFGNEVHGTTRLYYGKEVHQPKVGEFFIMWGRAYEVVKVAFPTKESKIAPEFEALEYPRFLSQFTQRLEMRLERNGTWVQSGNLYKRTLPPHIYWGEFRAGTGGVS